MQESFEELVTKHTRRELEEMALTAGVENLGGTKSQLAEAIIEASKRQKDASKPGMPEKPKEVQMTEKPKVGPEKQKAQSDKKGVMAKAAAINSKSAEFQSSGKEIRDKGIQRRVQGLSEFNSARDKMCRDMSLGAKQMMDDGIQRRKSGLNAFANSLSAQIKENKEASARFNSGSREICSEMERMASEFQRAGKNIRDEGTRNLQRNLKQFRKSVDSQINENQKAISRIGSAAMDLQARAISLQRDIQRYHDQDLKDYMKDFYYG